MRLPVLAALPLLAAAGAAPADEAERGRELALRWCAECHVVAPDVPGADAGPAFPTLSGRSDEELRVWLSDPHPPMPNLELSGRDIEALIAHIRAVAGDG